MNNNVLRYCFKFLSICFSYIYNIHFVVSVERVCQMDGRSVDIVTRSVSFLPDLLRPIFEWKNGVEIEFRVRRISLNHFKYLGRWVLYT